MPKATTSITIEGNLLDEVKKRKIVLSHFVDQKLREFVAQTARVEEETSKPKTKELKPITFELVEAVPELAQKTLEADNIDQLLSIAHQYRWLGKRVGVLHLNKFRAIKGKEQLKKGVS